LISKPSSFAFDVAVSSVEHDARLLRELERQLTLRLPSAPPLRPVWTTAATELLDAPRPGVFGKTARVVVVLHQHLWGKDATTKDDAEAIKRRITAKGPESVRVVLLDRTTPPTWLRKSPSRALGAPDQCADWIVSAVADLGGVTRQTASDAVVEIPVADQRSLQQRLCQPLEQSIFANDVFRLLVPLQQLVHEIGLDFVHAFSLSIAEERLHKKSYTLGRPERYSEKDSLCPAQNGGRDEYTHQDVPPNFSFARDSIPK